VVNIHTIKPLDKEIIINAARKTGALVVAEEHNIIGGLGSAVTEAVCEACPVPVTRVGVEDQYGRSGKVPALLEYYGLTPANIVAKAKAAIALKK
jgi:transketolase